MKTPDGIKYGLYKPDENGNPGTLAAEFNSTEEADKWLREQGYSF